jgi:hypothetical protein
MLDKNVLCYSPVGGIIGDIFLLEFFSIVDNDCCLRKCTQLSVPDLSIDKDMRKNTSVWHTRVTLFYIHHM